MKKLQLTTFPMDYETTNQHDKDIKGRLEAIAKDNHHNFEVMQERIDEIEKKHQKWTAVTVNSLIH